MNQETERNWVVFDTYYT